VPCLAQKSVIVAIKKLIQTASQSPSVIENTGCIFPLSGVWKITKKLTEEVPKKIKSTPEE
jgi:hypothetical protein